MFRDGESHENQQLRSCAAGVTCKRNDTFQIFLCFVVFGIRLQQYTHDYCQSMEEKKTHVHTKDMSDTGDIIKTPPIPMNQSKEQHIKQQFQFKLAIRANFQSTDVSVFFW